MNTVLSWSIGAVITTLVMFIGAGCEDPQAAEKAEIRTLMAEFGAAGQQRDGKARVARMSQSSVDHYTNLVKLALDGSEADMRRLGAADLIEILLIRSLASRKDVKGKDGRAYLIWATEQGWYASDEDEYSSWTDGMADIQIDRDGQRAWCYILEDHKRTRFSITFEKGPERWQFVETSVYDYFDHWTKELARDSGESQEEFLMWLVEESLNIEIDRGTIWKPMKK